MLTCGCRGRAPRSASRKPTSARSCPGALDGSVRIVATAGDGAAVARHSMSTHSRVARRLLEGAAGAERDIAPWMAVEDHRHPSALAVQQGPDRLADRRRVGRPGCGRPARLHQRARPQSRDGRQHRHACQEHRGGAADARRARRRAAPHAADARRERCRGTTHAANACPEHRRAAPHPADGRRVHDCTAGLRDGGRAVPIPVGVSTPRAHPRWTGSTRRGLAGGCSTSVRGASAKPAGQPRRSCSTPLALTCTGRSPPAPKLLAPKPGTS